jgi:hypothetical protein
MSESVEAIKPKSRFTWTASDRSEWLDLFRGSRQSAAQFCHETGLPQATLSLWLNQQALAEAREACESEFVEVSFTAPTAALPAPAAAVPAVTVHWPNGTRLEVNMGADAAWVGQLLRACAPAGV